MSQHESHTSALASHSNTPATIAGLAILAWVGGEFAFRRGLAPHLADALGSGLGADMVAIAIGMPLLAGLIAWLGARAGITRDDWAYDTSLRPLLAGIGGFLAYVAVFFTAALLYMQVLGIQPASGPGALGIGSAPTWALAALVLVNGVLVPITEELAWRGVIQTALMERFGTTLGIVATAIPFVLKHLIVDMAAPPFRVTSLVVMAFILGGLRARYGTASSTAVHLSANGLFTLLAVLA